MEDTIQIILFCKSYITVANSMTIDSDLEGIFMKILISKKKHIIIRMSGINWSKILVN